MAQNSNLTAAKKAKNDEFYTQSSDIEAELKYYRKHFKGQVVYCNCDDPIESNFWHYFYRSFGFLGLKKLISTHYEQDGKSSYALIYEGGHDNAPKFNEGVKWVPLKGNGDFRSEECINYLKQADIVVTNPMFSLFREYVVTLMKYHKKFLIWGNQNAITYKEFFPLLMQRKVWIGAIANKTCVFQIPDDYKKWDKKETERHNDGHHYAKVPAITTFTNMSLDKPTDQMVIWKQFDQNKYLAYDNYPAFDVSRIADIPKTIKITAFVDLDHLDGWKKVYGNDLNVISVVNEKAKVEIDRPILGVPITFMGKYNPSSTLKQHNLAEEFDILDTTTATDNQYNLGIDYSSYKGTKQDGSLNGRTGSTFGNCPVIREDDGKHVFYESPDGIRVQAVYKRILIRAKKGARF